VMIMVSFETFDWRSLRTFRQMPIQEAIVMPFTVLIVLLTHDLAKGVLAGILLSVLLFGWQAAQIKVTTTDTDDSKVYHVAGQLFFGSATPFVEQFDWDRDPASVTIDLQHTQVWDHSAAAAIGKVVAHYQRLGKSIQLMGLDHQSYQVMARSGVPIKVMEAVQRVEQVA
jgi:sulfate permease, SulP family